MADVADPLFNGARLRQLPELFPKAAFAGDADGLIRASTVGNWVYLTSNHEIAQAYGAIPGREYIERHRKGDPMAFLPAGVVLTLNPDLVSARELTAEEITAKIPDQELNTQICVAEGPIPSAALIGVEIIFFDRIAADPTVELIDAIGQPITRRTPRDLWLLKRQLGLAAHAIQGSYDHLTVDTIEIGMTADEAITLFERT